MVLLQKNPLTLALCSILLAVLALDAAHAAETNFTAGAQVLAPTQLASNVELFNPVSGFYTSLIQNPNKFNNYDLNFQYLNLNYSDPAPLPGAPLNEYGRTSWHALEPVEGQYNFSIIDNVLKPCPQAAPAVCLPQGTKFGFRIMAFNPQTPGNTNVTTGMDGYPVYSEVPDYIERDAKGKTHGWLLPVDPSDPAQGHYFVPDWNDPFFLKRIDALLHALGQRYDRDPRIGPIDIGLYGSWGEWHTSGLPDAADYKQGIPYTSTAPYYELNTAAYLANTGTAGAYQAGTDATKNSIVDAHVRAFRNKQLVMLTDDGEALCYALQIEPSEHGPIGMRRDSFGSSDFAWQFPGALPNCDTAANQSMIADRWQTAPFTVEPFGNGSSPTFPCQTFETDSATGAYDITEQVTNFHLASVKNASMCTGLWDALSPSEQQAWLAAGQQAGSRLSPLTVRVSEFYKGITRDEKWIWIHTFWSNTGVAPTYENWQVVFSLQSTNSSTPTEINFVSHVNLRKILPTGTTPIRIEDSFPLEDVPPGQYELIMRVVDPHDYMLPMQLALKNTNPDGSYPLGVVVIH